MRRFPRRTGSLAVGIALLCGSAAPARAADHADSGTGLPVPLGPAAVAVSDWTRGSFGNPALLLGAERPEWLAGLGLDADGSPLQSMTLWAPLSDSRAMAFGFTHSEPRAGFARRDEWSLAAATRLGGALRLGSTVKLRNETAAGISEPSFGLDVGVHATPAARRFGPDAGLDLGLWLQNAVRPQLQTSSEIERDSQALWLAAAYSRRLAGGWRGTGTLALENRTATTGSAWLGARIASRHGLDVAFAACADAWRAGVALHRGRAGLEYALADDREIRHALVVRCGFGSTLAERQAAAQSDLDQRVATRLQQEIEARETRDVETLLVEGRAALDGGGYELAAERFRSVLLWRPNHEVARAGLRRAQLGSMLQQADSLVAHHDYWSAASQLEHAVRLFPEDSLAAARLEEARGVVSRADRSRSEAAEQFRLGLDAFASQHYAAAIRCFEMAQGLDTTHKLAPEFVQRSRQALEAQIQTTILQARGRLERRDAEGARSALLSALDAAPGHPDATRFLAQIDKDLERQSQDRRVAEARRQEEANREDRAPSPAQMPHLTSTYQRGMAMYRAGELTAAMQAWEDVARRAPHFAEVDQYLLRVYRVVGLESYTEGHLQSAIEIWSKALQLEPENQQVRRYMDQANAKLQRSQGTRGTR